MRYDTSPRLRRGDLQVDEVAMGLGLGRRQVFRLLDRMRADGAEVLVSRKRGRSDGSAQFETYEPYKLAAISMVRRNLHWAQLSEPIQTMDIQSLSSASIEASGRRGRSHLSLMN